MCTKIQWSEYSDFVKYLINIKKNPKNIKFDLQVCTGSATKYHAKASTTVAHRPITRFPFERDAIICFALQRF